MRRIALLVIGFVFVIALILVCRFAILSFGASQVEQHKQLLIKSLDEQCHLAFQEQYYNAQDETYSDSHVLCVHSTNFASYLCQCS